MAYYFKTSSFFLVALLLTGLLISASEAALANHASHNKIAQTRNGEIAHVLAGTPGRKLIQTLSPETELKIARGMNNVKNFFVNAGNKIADVATGAWNGVKNFAKSLWPF
ncbi:hypothetical protein Sjap_021703 [Stephania japonica]|uniref:Uncharacterized protein n=1 Tax=Stephania japonica TaxID=461633 RepID=A0AAP0EMY4_9MAGN